MSKRIIYLLFIFLCLNSLRSLAQAPEGINYQAVFRNPNGQIVSGASLSCKIEIWQGSTSGIEEYAEKHTVITNQQGIANFVIGQGLTTTGVFSDIDWGNGPYYLKLFVDFDGQGTTFQMEQYGSQMLVSVPYALHAKVTDSIAGVNLNNLGSAGLSAYEIAVQNGFVGTEAEWLASLQGTDGQNGVDGTDGQNGVDGQDGTNGLSAYEIAVQNGFVGTEAEWLTSLQGTDGQDGTDGINGQDGTNGLSAYEIALQNGFNGTEAEWLASLQGTDGQNGADGQDGTDGINGQDGTNGLSAYEIAVQNGFIGTEAEWIASLQGADGQDGADGTNGQNGADGQDGTDGTNGLSAYEIALQNGFVGTEAEWLASLQGTDGQNGADGTDGQDGTNGLSAYEIAVQNGFVGTEAEWLASLQGTDGQDGTDGQNGADGTNGLSAYEIAVQNGFVGTEAEWLASLQGTDGQDGTDGQNGADGQDGTDGTNGLSAYEIAVQNGFIGTEAEWLASLQGTDGQDGVDGQGGVTEAGLNVNITGSGTPLDPYIIDANPTISTDGTPGNISLNDGGGTVLINVDDADNNAINELNTGASFNNNILEIQDAGGAVTADLSALDNSGTDDQNASEVFYDNTISGLGGNEVQSAIDQLALDMTTNGVATIRQYTNSDFLSDCATLGSGTWQTIAVIPGISAQSSQVNTRASYAKFQLYDYSAISGGGRSQELLEFNVSRFWDDGQIQLLNHNVPSTTPASIKIEKIRLQYGKVSVGGGSVDCANIQIYRSHTCGNQNNATTNIFVKMTNQIPLTETPLVIIPMELTSTPLSLTNITTDEINILNNNGDDVNDADADPNNEIQDLSLNNNILSLSQSNESVDLSQYLEDPLWMRNSSESHLYPTNLSDNIGLGTNAPSTKLDVVGVLELSNVLPTDPGTDIVRLGDGGTQLQVQTNYGYTRIGPSNSGYAHFYTDRPKYFFDKRIILDEGILSSYNEDLSLQTSGTTRFTIDNDNGNVGIGTSSSNHKLKVVSSGTGDLWPTLGGHIASFKGSGTSNTSVASILIENNNESALYMGVNSSNNTTGAAGAGGAFIGTWSNSSSQKDLLLMTGGTSAIRLKPATSTSSQPARAVVESRLETPGGHLPNYDSGWISASVGNRYTFTHGLASYMLDVTVFIKDNEGNIFNASAGAGVGLDYGGDYEGGMTVYMVTDAQIQIAFGNDAMFTHDNTTISPTFTKITSGQIRVIAYTTGLSD